MTRQPTIVQPFAVVTDIRHDRFSRSGFVYVAGLAVAAHWLTIRAA